MLQILANIWLLTHRPSTTVLDDPAAHNSAMAINSKGETHHTLDPARLRWIALHLCKARHQPIATNSQLPKVQIPEVKVP